MARTNISLNNSAKLATGTAARTMLQLVAPTNQRVAVKSAEITFDGTDPSGQPILVQLLRQTSAGTGRSARTVTADDTDIATAVQSTGTEWITSATEPTSATNPIVRNWLIHPQAGVLYTWPLGDEIVIPGAGRLGLVVTAPVSVNAVAVLRGEE